MKKIIIGLGLLGSLTTYADFTTVKVKEFTGSYKKPDGRATASELIVPTSNKGNIEITVQGDENGYHLVYGDKEFYFKNPPKFINDIYSGTWKSVNYVTESKNLSASINSLETVLPESDTNLKNFSMSCKENRSFESYGHQVMDACLKNSILRLGYLKSSSTTKIMNILEDLPGVRSSTTIVQDAVINISNHSLKMSAKIDIGMSAKVKIEGRTHYDDSAKRVVVRIDKAKASFLNIRNKIFNELKKSETEDFKVQKPYIYIKVK